MDLLSSTGREYTRTGAHFTVRSANSLSYSLERRPFRNSRYWKEEEEEKSKYSRETRTEPVSYYQSKTYSGVKGLGSLERDTFSVKQNQIKTEVKSVNYGGGQEGNSERQGRTERRSSNLSNRSKSLDWRTGDKSPERKLNYRADTWRRNGDYMGAEGSRVRSTVQAYNDGLSGNSQPSSPSKGNAQTLPSRLTAASFGPTGGQSIMERIEKLYGSSDFGNTGDYKTTEPQTCHKDWSGGTFPRRFSTGEHKQRPSRSSLSWTTYKDASTWNSQGINWSRTSGQWQSQTYSTRLSDIGTRSLDRARSRSTRAAQIRANRAAENMAGSEQPETVLKEISEVKNETNKDMDRKSWSRTTVRERNPVKTDQTWTKAETPSDDVFVNSEKAQHKSFEKKPLTAKPQLTASVRNKINQFEALSQRAQASSPRRAFSVPEHISRTCDGVQRSSSAKAIGTAQLRWGGVADNQTVSLERDKKLQQDKTTTKDINLRTFSVDGSKVEKESPNTDSNEMLNKYNKLKTNLELPLVKDSEVTGVDETDFSKTTSPMIDVKTSSSEISTSTSDDDKTPTNTPDRSPLPSPSTAPQKTPPFVNEPLDISPPLVSNLPDLVSRGNQNGVKRVMDLNAWLEGLNPQITAWGDGGEDDDDSTQKDEDSNYDSDSGESSVTITSAVSNKSFSVSLADLCNFAGVDYDSENDSDEWQPTGRRSASLSSDISGFSYVSVLPTEELDKLIEDVKSLGDNSLQDYEDVHVVVLHKDIGVGLGFSLAGGVDQNKPVTVHKVFHSGIAAQEGSITEGDQVLSINGTALSSCHHWEALRVLRRAKGREMGVVVLKKPDVRAVSNGRAVAVNQSTHANEKGQCINVILEKSNRDLGFSLEGGVGSSLGNKPLSVQKIFQGGPVEKILPGDEVLEVDGVSVVGMRRLEAWNLIRKLPPGPVSVTLLRKPPTQRT